MEMWVSVMCADENRFWQEKQRVGQECLQFAAGYALSSVLKQPTVKFQIHTKVVHTIPHAAKLNVKPEMQLLMFFFW